MAMTIQDYEKRISDAEDKLKKIDKRIKKWEDAKSDAKFAKQYEWMRAGDGSWSLGWDGQRTVYGTFDEFKALRYQKWVDECDREIKYANRDKEDTLTMIDKYKNAVALLKEKDSKPVIQIFKDFFNGWKAEIIKYVKPVVDHYYEIRDKRIELANQRYDYEEAGFKTKEEYDAAYKELYDEEKELLSEPIVNIAVENGFRRDPADFIYYLDDYMNKRYFELVDKVTKIVGEISDVSNLRVGGDGTLNGKVYGDKGGAKIETIIAGGYNTDIIVNVKHGQIRHYRVLVHPIKQ